MFASLGEAITRVDAVDAGLIGYAFTTGLANAKKIMHGVQTGMIGIDNLIICVSEMPFGDTAGLHACLTQRLATLG